jgi:LmbE family N-acetylglucosaminyl deacetylase
MNLIVDDIHLGTPERDWTSCLRMAEMAPLRPLHPHRVVVVAPHPDDEIFGAAGLLQGFLPQRVPIEIISVTDGEASHPDSAAICRTDLRSIRAHERDEALRRIGCLNPVIRQLGLPDGRVQDHIDQLSEMLDEILRPDDLCLTPWCHDGHPDHDACGDVAARIAHSNGADLLAYLVWAWHWADPNANADLPWDNCRRLDLSRRVAARKRWSTGAFPSQTHLPSTGGRATPVIPPAILRRFWRTFEVFVDGESDR